MKYLHRYVIETYAPDWKAIGFELNLKASALDVIAEHYPQKSTACFDKTLKKWLDLNPGATWEMLEAAITNVRRAKLGLKPVADVYSEYGYICYSDMLRIFS